MEIEINSYQHKLSNNKLRYFFIFFIFFKLFN